MAKLQDLYVSFISLVKSPANQKDIIAKTSDGTLKFNHTQSIKIIKTDKQGLIYGVVYEANKKDSHGDWADMETIRKAAHKFMEKGHQANVDTEHNTNKSGSVIVESYLTDTAWNVVIKCDPAGEVFQKVLKGDYQGLSLMGVCVRGEGEPPKEDETKSLPPEAVEKIAQLESALKDLQRRHEELLAMLKTTNLSRQLQFDMDGNAVVKDDDSEIYSEFKFEEVKYAR